MGSLSLLQGIFLTQGSNQGLLTCRRVLYQLNCQGNHEKDLGFHPKNTEGQTILSRPTFTSLKLTGWPCWHQKKRLNQAGVAGGGKWEKKESLLLQTLPTEDPAAPHKLSHCLITMALLPQPWHVPASLGNHWHRLPPLALHDMWMPALLPPPQHNPFSAR